MLLETGEEHEVPTCTNGATTWALSQPETRRNCNVSKDAHYSRQDGKTPGPLLQLDIGALHVMCRIGGSRRSARASGRGDNLEIPPFPWSASNFGPLSGSRTVSGGQFHWGGGLLKCNGGAQRFPQPGRQSGGECKGTRELDCETYKSSRYESRA